MTGANDEAPATGGVGLSVVVPCFDEERRLPVTLARLEEWLVGMTDWELVVVDDHSRDRTRELLASFAATRLAVRLVSSHGKGKGAAVRTGVLATRGAHVLVSDADLAGDLEAVPEMRKRLAGADGVLASRHLPGASVEPSRPIIRRISAWTFRRALRILTPLRYSDPQCGFKLYSGDVAREIFAEVTLTGYAYEVEALLLADAKGWRLVEHPIAWREGPFSKVHVLRDGIAMLVDARRAARRLARAG